MCMVNRCLFRHLYSGYERKHHQPLLHRRKLDRYNPDLTFSCNVAEKNKLVLRNKNCGIKHFRLLSEIDGISVIDKAGLIIKNTKESKSFIFDLEEINKFIEFAVNDVIQNIEKVEEKENKYYNCKFFKNYKSCRRKCI